MTTEHFGTKGGDRVFRGAYVTPPEFSLDQQVTRTYTGVLGQIIEDAATRAIMNPVVISEEKRDKFKGHLDDVVNYLRPKILAITMPDDKTLSHSAVLPYYIETFRHKSESIDFLSYNIDSHLGLYMQQMYDDLLANKSEDNQFVNSSKIKYFLDTLIIISKLNLYGIGEDFKHFGQLVPDVHLRNGENLNKESTQLDGVFIPPGITVPNISDPGARESFIRSLANKDVNYPIGAPPILRIPAFLEVKAQFRPRQTARNLTQHIPPYQVTQMTDRLATALIDANIAVMPRAIVFLRLRSLGPFYVNTLYLNSGFYWTWEEHLLKKFEAARDPDENLPMLIAYLATCREEVNSKELERLAKASPTFDEKTAEQKDLF